MEKINISPDFVFSPQPMYLVGTKNEDGSANFCVITWIGFSVDKTPHLMMTIGGTKQTKTNILRERKFSANLINEENIWLADYFGSVRGEERSKNDVAYRYQWGKSVDVPILEETNWCYECEVTKIIELDGSHLFLADIKNIQIDSCFVDMDKNKIDLSRLKPTVYAPYHYYSIGDKLGDCGEWKKHLKSKSE